jgi:hypothetical protein
VTSGGRPQIGFLIPGVVGVSLYLETDSTMRIINSGGAVARLHDTLHLLAGTDLAAGAAQANLGFPPINKNGDTMTGVQHVFQRDLALSGSSYAQAPLLVASASTNVNYRAGIGFENRNRVGVFLFVDNDNKFKFIDGGGVVHVISST